MSISIPVVDLTFGDFTLLAILLTIMYGLTALETGGAIAGKLVGTLNVDRRKAATWAFGGLLATLVAGVFAGHLSGGIEGLFLLVPLFFIGHWAYYHGRIASVLDFTELTRTLDEHYDEVVLKCVPDSPRGALTSAQVFATAVQKVHALPLLEGGVAFARRVVPVPARALLGELLFTPDKAAMILRKLTEAHLVARVVDQEGEKFCLSPKPGL